MSAFAARQSDIWLKYIKNKKTVGTQESKKKTVWKLKKRIIGQKKMSRISDLINNIEKESIESKLTPIEKEAYSRMVINGGMFPFSSLRLKAMVKAIELERERKEKPHNKQAAMARLGL